MPHTMDPLPVSRASELARQRLARKRERERAAMSLTSEEPSLLTPSGTNISLPASDTSQFGGGAGGGGGDGGGMDESHSQLSYLQSKQGSGYDSPFSSNLTRQSSAVPSTRPSVMSLSSSAAGSSGWRRREMHRNPDEALGIEEEIDWGEEEDTMDRIGEVEVPSFPLARLELEPQASRASSVEKKARRWDPHAKREAEKAPDQPADFSVVKPDGFNPKKMGIDAVYKREKRREERKEMVGKIFRFGRKKEEREQEAEKWVEEIEGRSINPSSKDSSHQLSLTTSSKLSLAYSGSSRPAPKGILKAPKSRSSVAPNVSSPAPSTTHTTHPTHTTATGTSATLVGTASIGSPTTYAASTPATSIENEELFHNAISHYPLPPVRHITPKKGRPNTADTITPGSGGLVAGSPGKAGTPTPASPAPIGSTTPMTPAHHGVLGMSSLAASHGNDMRARSALDTHNFSGTAYNDEDEHEHGRRYSESTNESHFTGTGTGVNATQTSLVSGHDMDSSRLFYRAPGTPSVPSMPGSPGGLSAPAMQVAASSSSTALPMGLDDRIGNGGGSGTEREKESAPPVPPKLASPISSAGGLAPTSMPQRRTSASFGRAHSNHLAPVDTYPQPPSPSLASYSSHASHDSDSRYTATPTATAPGDNLSPEQHIQACLANGWSIWDARTCARLSAIDVGRSGTGASGTGGYTAKARWLAYEHPSLKVYREKDKLETFDILACGKVGWREWLFPVPPDRPARDKKKSDGRRNRRLKSRRHCRVVRARRREERQAREREEEEEEEEEEEDEPVGMGKGKMDWSKVKIDGYKPKPKSKGDGNNNTAMATTTIEVHPSTPASERERMWELAAHASRLEIALQNGMTSPTSMAMGMRGRNGPSSQSQMGDRELSPPPSSFRPRDAPERGSWSTMLTTSSSVRSSGSAVSGVSGISDMTMRSAGTFGPGAGPGAGAYVGGIGASGNTRNLPPQLPAPHSPLPPIPGQGQGQGQCQGQGHYQHQPQTPSSASMHSSHSTLSMQSYASSTPTGSSITGERRRMTPAERRRKMMQQPVLDLAGEIKQLDAERESELAAMEGPIDEDRPRVIRFAGV